MEVRREAVAAVAEVEELVFHFKTHSVFLGLNQRFLPGLTWLRGSNGRGKTTLLRLLGGLLVPNSGTIRLGQLDARRDALAYRAACFYCGGEAPDLEWLTAREWLELHLSLYPGADSDALARRLDAFRIDRALEQPVSGLSLGQYKKLQLSLALSLPARLLLIDEPFNGLDAQAVGVLEDELTRREAARETCIVLTSHVAPRVLVTHELDLDRQVGAL